MDGQNPALNISIPVTKTSHPKIYQVGTVLCHGKAELRVELNKQAKVKVLELVDGLFGEVD